MDPRTEQLQRLVEIVDRLRDECPWDREQTLETMAPCVQEEVAELQDAVALGAPPLVREELGDLLMNVLLMARIAEQAGDFDLGGVAADISEKLVRRHPHVFTELEVSGTGEVLANWERIKAEEKRGADSPEPERRSAMDGIPRQLPVLGRATKMMQRAARAGFDWPSGAAAFDKVEEELAEVRAAGEEGEERLEEEVGDLLLALTTACRKVRVDPDLALRRACQRFDRRFRVMEQLRGADPQELSVGEWESLWQQAKAREASP